jgi:branched-chain amino acid transport system ATP-binding protein
VSVAALQLETVSAGYGQTVVLEDINISLSEGESLSIIGRNGVGKTTLLATVMGHTTLHGGSIKLQGKDIGSMVPYRRNWAGLGYVPQEREIFPSLTLRENLEVAVRPGRWTIEAVYKVGNPTVLLMDEPSEGLAPVIVEELTRAVKQLAQAEGLALLLVEQNTRVALQISPRTIVMDRGRIVFDGASEELQRDPVKLEKLIGVAHR